jgi:hypothetical protein
MKQGHSFFSRKSIWLVLISSLSCLLVGIIACVGLASIIFPNETRAPEAFPNTDIVFIAGRDLGFVNADGTNLEYIRLVVAVNGDTSTVWPWRPVMTADNRTLIVKMSDTVKFVFQPHYLAVWRPDAFPILCANWPNQQMPQLTADQRHIVILTEQGTAIYTLEACGTADEPVRIYEDIFGIPSPDLQYLAYTNRPGVMANDDRFIVIRNMTTDEESTIGVGDYPAWSRDSRSLAYTGPDGIYVFNILDDSKPRRVVLFPNLFDQRDRTYASRDYWEVPPEVSWSPDGKWLVYDKWTGTDYDQGFEPYDHVIFKLNIETGEEIKIIDHGMYPFWRWPIESQQ